LLIKLFATNPVTTKHALVSFMRVLLAVGIDANNQTLLQRRVAHALRRF
jgi:hypothetical protein